MKAKTILALLSLAACLSYLTPRYLTMPGGDMRNLKPGDVIMNIHTGKWYEFRKWIIPFGGPAHKTAAIVDLETREESRWGVNYIARHWAMADDDSTTAPLP